VVAVGGFEPTKIYLRLREMELTKEEEEMLKGEDGFITMRCIEYLVKYGEAAGAERLVDIDGIADLLPNPEGVDQPTGISLKDQSLHGRHFKVPTFTLPATFCIDGWEDLSPPHNDPELHNKNMEGLKPYWRLGAVPTCSCNYYLFSSYNPMVGHHCACGESSLIPWLNAILGARTNFDNSFAAAWTGKTPVYDMHLDKNRKATRLVNCDVELKMDMDYELFGWVVGEAVGIEVPVITGLGKPTATQIVKMNAALNTGGQVRMYHVPGLTPETPSVEAALQGKEPEEIITVKREDMKRVYDLLQYASNEDVDFVSLGCPHYTIKEIQRVVYMLEGRRCKVNLWIMTNPWTFKVAEMMGYRDIIRRAGGVLLSSSCPSLMGFVPPNTNVVALDAAKQNYYLTGTFYPEKLQVWYGTTEECIEAALTGKWKGKWQGDE